MLEMKHLPSPEKMLTYASILEKPRYYIHTDGRRYLSPNGEIIEAACATLRYCATLKAIFEADAAAPEAAFTNEGDMMAYLNNEPYAPPACT